MSGTCAALVQFADDTSAIISHKTLNTAVDLTKLLIERMSDWCRLNRLVLNSSKTQLINFVNINAHQESEIVLKIGDSHFRTQNQPVKFLGLLIDKNSICKKIASDNFA